MHGCDLQQDNPILMSMKPATSKALLKSPQRLTRICSFAAALFALFACLGCESAYGAGVEATGDSLPPRNRHFFLVRLEQGSLNGQTEEIRNAFLRHEFTDCELQPSTDAVRLICEKGCTVDRAREVLKELGLVMTTYQEAYTNQTPEFFR
jgi:hypothetical protein